MTKTVSTFPICKKCENFLVCQGMKMGDSVGLIYAGIIIVGGFVGYLKAGSTASLAAGLVFGGTAGFGAQFNNNPMLLAISSGLTLIMGSRFIQSGKVMPSGIVAILSLGMVIRCLLRYIH
uniref:Transmembrane protein 14C n=1 Tax=Wuchereria bancrofti TaxID=6293 RepID=A0AAF5Q0C6_WUCBA